jgi:hypothetical protein
MDRCLQIPRFLQALRQVPLRQVRVLLLKKIHCHQ